MVKVLLVSAALVIASPLHASGFVVTGGWYVPGTNTEAAPFSKHSPIADFGVRYEGAGRLRLIGGMESTMAWVHGWRSLRGVLYHAGVRYTASPWVTLEAVHGSWHNIDTAGPRTGYHRLGMEVRLP